MLGEAGAAAAAAAAGWKWWRAHLTKAELGFVKRVTPRASAMDDTVPDDTVARPSGHGPCKSRPDPPPPPPTLLPRPPLPPALAAW